MLSLKRKKWFFDNQFSFKAKHSTNHAISIISFMLDEKQEVIEKENMDYQDQVQGLKQPHSMDSRPPVQVL